MAWPSTLTWKLAERLQTYLSKNSPFKGADMAAEFDNIYNSINYLAGNGLGEPLADITALRAVPPESTGPTATDVPRRDKQLRRVDSVIGPSSSTSTQIYQFRAASAAADADAGNLDTDGIVSPDTGTGRWHRVPSNAIYNRGADGLVTFYRNGITDLNTDTYGDIAWKYLGKSASTFIKLTFNKELRIRNDADSDYQDVLLKALTASGNIAGAGTNNTLTGTPPASAVLALLQMGTAPVGASASGNYKTINAAAGFAGLFELNQVDGVDKYRQDASGNTTQAGNVIAQGTNNKFTGSPAASTTEALIRLVNALASGHASGTLLGANLAAGFGGNLIDLQINGTRIFRTDSTGRTKGANAVDNDEFTTLSQVNTLIAASSTIWGDGSDGTVTISANTTLTADKYYAALTVDATKTLTTAGFSVFVNGQLSWNGIIKSGDGANGSAGGNADATTCTKGTGGAGGANTRGSLASLDGKAGGNGGTPGASPAAPTTTAGDEVLIDVNGVAGSVGGTGGNGGGAGAAGGAAGTIRKFTAKEPTSSLSATRAPGFFARGGATGGGGGGSGTCGGGGNGAGGGGGGAGAAAQTGLIVAKTVVYGASSSATGVGGNGGNGGTGDQAGGGGGGGAGGCGALFVVISTSYTGSINSTTFTGGSAGTGAAGGAGGTAGANGAAGGAGVFVQIDI